MLVSVSEPAMKTQLRLPPARKYSLASLPLRSALRQCHQVMTPTAAVSRRKTANGTSGEADRGAGWGGRRRGVLSGGR